MAKPFNSANPLAYEWTEKAFDLLHEGKLEATATIKEGVTLVSASGTCPYCEDHLNFTDSLTAVTEGSEGALGGGADAAEENIEAVVPEPVYQDFTVTCGCTTSHDGDPKKGTGCGTSFRVSVIVSNE